MPLGFYDFADVRLILLTAKCSVAVWFRAQEWFFSSMNSFMISHVFRSIAVLLAEAAFKSRLPNHIENKRVEALKAVLQNPWVQIQST